MKVVIVGGVAGGATAATRIRRLDERAQITVFERSGYISYANCGLPYYIGGVIEDSQELTLQTPESFKTRFRINVKVKHEVTDIDTKRKTVTVRNLDTGEEFKEDYDKLILSPGAKPIRPNLPGTDSKRLFSLRTVEDTFCIRQFVEEQKPKTAVMVGGGFIGLEVAENLCELGIKVSVIQRGNQLLNTLDYDMATLVHTKLRSKGIDLKLGANVVAFEETKTGLDVLLENGESVNADMVLMAVGVSPENTLAKKAGLELGLKGAIVVNDKMQTSVSDIYAVGDAVQIKHTVTNDDAVISLAGPANKQGRIAADNICGLDSHYKGSLGSSVIKLFDMTAAATGLTEKAVQSAGICYDKIVLSPSSHAGYYPGAKIMTMKVVYEKDTLKILGAQIVGYDGADKRIDVLATAIGAGMKADKLKDLDLAYAPPYSSAKDPVNMAGFMIENIKNGIVKQFHWNEVADLPTDGSVTLLDTRTEKEYARGHADGFINIPVDELRERLNEIDLTKPLYVMCQSGLRSYIACRILSQEGYDCYNFSGGYRFYSAIKNEKAIAEQSYPCGMDK
ncbi:MAG: CoA-disulfide reductase [Acutalibacteraceae bacterium]|nr:CoA-disulfide reductase [Acutalibacteraceae bacterium]